MIFSYHANNIIIIQNTKQGIMNDTM